MTTMRQELDKLLRTMECYDYDADEYKGRHVVHSFAAMLATVLIKNDAHLAKGSQVPPMLEHGPAISSTAAACDAYVWGWNACRAAMLSAQADAGVE